MTSLRITTCRLPSSFSAGKANEKGLAPTEWLRKSLSRFVKEAGQEIMNQGGDPSLFYNHLPVDGKTRIGYPLVIYHFIDGCFYITGINEGSNSLRSFAELNNKPFRVDDIQFDGLQIVHEASIQAGICNEENRYSLTHWLPLHHKDLKGYKEISLEEKTLVLNERLHKHIVQELGKYLEINFDGLSVRITDITFVHKPVFYKKYEYPGLDIIFTANAILPQDFTLGNNKSLGFGRIEPL